MATATAGKTTVGVFDTRAAAERAIADLKTAGYRDDQIGMVAKNDSGKTVHTDGAGETYADEGAGIGAAVGALGGVAIGAGVLAGVIPVIGPAIMAGTLGTILTNALGGAAIAGLAGALVGWGIPEEDAEYYQSEVASGKYLVTVENAGREQDSWGVFSRHGAYNRTNARSTAACSTASSTSSARTDSSRTDAGRTVQLKEEQLHASKQPVQTGEVNVRKEVHTEHKQITVPVEREEVVIERRRVDGTAAAGSIKAEEIRIPVKEERVNVTKETVVKEEVTVGKKKVQEQKTVTGDVRVEELKVETEGRTNVRQTGNTDKK